MCQSHHGGQVNVDDAEAQADAELRNGSPQCLMAHSPEGGSTSQHCLVLKYLVSYYLKPLIFLTFYPYQSDTPL